MQTISHVNVTDVTPGLQHRLTALVTLGLNLKQAHWNLTGPNFISVHELLDTLVADIRNMSDDIAERARALGAAPRATAGALVAERTVADHAIGVGPAYQHLAALLKAYEKAARDHREAIDMVGVDPVTEDLLIGQTARLEHHAWLLRSHMSD